MGFEFEVCVLVDGGRSGLPLALAFARAGLSVSVHEADAGTVASLRGGVVPYLEPGAEEALRAVLGRNLHVADDPTLIARSRHVVVMTGTTIDQHLNPSYNQLRRLHLRLIAPHLVDGQCLIMRNTIFPGTTAKIGRMVAKSGRDVAVAFCPDRTAAGNKLREISEFPQVVSGCDPRAEDMAAELFGRISKSIVKIRPAEAELAKIFANVWRYIQFATANQFFMIAADHGIDFYRVYDALTRDYPRMAGLPKSGFTAGPSLFKDTMQLAAAANNNFALGHAAMLINEGLPNFVVRHLKAQYPLSKLRVGVLGMAFKADSDDPRESLSYKLRKILEYEAGEVLCTDVYIKGPDFVPLDVVLERADLVILATPHREYRGLTFPEATAVVDIWNAYGHGASLERRPRFRPRDRAPGAGV